MNISARTD